MTHRTTPVRMVFWAGSFLATPGFLLTFFALLADMLEAHQTKSGRNYLFIAEIEILGLNSYSDKFLSSKDFSYLNILNGIF